MFSKIQIENFRGIRHAEIDGLKQINLFFGKNNCGKSTVLEALFLITGQSNPILPLSINAMRNYNGFNEDDIKIDFYNLNPENKISIFAKGTPDRWLEISQIKSRSKTVNLESLTGGNSDIAANTYGLKLVYSIGNAKEKFSSEFILKDNNPENGKVSIDKRYKEEIFSLYLPSSGPQAALHEEFAKIVANKQESYILSALRQIDPAIVDIQLVGNDILVDIGAEQRLPINMAGDGLRKMLLIIVSIFRCRNGVLLIDEIDNGFHFTAMEILWKAILTAANDNNVQLFASTHNIDSIKGLSRVLEQTEFSDFRNDVGAFKLLKDADANITSLRYDYPSFSYSVNQELEMR